MRGGEINERGSGEWRAKNGTRRDGSSEGKLEKGERRMGSER